MNHELTHLDLFTGIGGFSIAAERAGFCTVGLAEIDRYCCGVLDRRFPGIRNYGDVCNAGAFAGIRGCTIVSAGYPCQPDSLGGLRRGEGDHRWLWPATADVLKVVGPTWFLGENVLGHVTLGLDVVLSDLESLGYSAQPFVIPACAVGAWHERNRAWIVAAQNREGDQTSAAADALRAGCGKLDTAAKPTDETKGDLWHAPVGAAALRYPCWDADFSEVLRMADGLSLGLDSRERNGRIQALGNAIVPQIAERFFAWIAQIERELA